MQTVFIRRALQHRTGGVRARRTHPPSSNCCRPFRHGDIRHERPRNPHSILFPGIRHLSKGPVSPMNRPVRGGSFLPRYVARLPIKPEFALGRPWPNLQQSEDEKLRFTQSDPKSRIFFRLRRIAQSEPGGVRTVSVGCPHPSYFRGSVLDYLCAICRTR